MINDEQFQTLHELYDIDPEVTEQEIRGFWPQRLLVSAEVILQWVQWRRTLSTHLSPPPNHQLPPLHKPPTELRSLTQIKEEYGQPVQNQPFENLGSKLNVNLPMDIDIGSPTTVVQDINQLPTPDASTSPELRSSSTFQDQCQFYPVATC